MDEKSAKEKIINSVTSPLGLLTLMVLVAETILFILTNRANGIDFTIIVIGMVSVMPLVLLLIFIKPNIVSPSPIATRRKIYDVFISAPMDAWGNNEAYKAHKTEVMNIRNALRDDCKFRRMFYAGVDLSSIDDFEVPEISAREDFDALAASKYCLLLYPKPLPTGALVEIGAAIALGIPCLLFTPSRTTLPFILREADSAFSSVRIHDAKDSAAVIVHLKNHGSNLFPK